jgi:hypothetical protein
MLVLGVARAGICKHVASAREIAIEPSGLERNSGVDSGVDIVGTGGP